MNLDAHSACAYLVDFSVNKWGTPIDLGQTIVANQQSISDQHEKLRSSVEARLDELTYVLSITAFSLINPFLSMNYIIKQ